MEAKKDVNVGTPTPKVASATAKPAVANTGVKPTVANTSVAPTAVKPTVTSSATAKPTVANTSVNSTQKVNVANTQTASVKKVKTKKPSSKTKKIINIISNIIFIPFCLIVLFCSIVTFSSKINGKVPSVFGKSVVQILSGSMVDDGFEIGDIVILKKIAPENIKIGDNIAFYSDTGVVIFHKVVDIKTQLQPGENKGDLFYQFVTNGVNNDPMATELVNENFVVGIYDSHDTLFTAILSVVISPIGSVILICVPSAILLVFLILNLRKEIDQNKAQIEAEKGLTDQELNKIMSDVQKEEQQKTNNSVKEKMDNLLHKVEDKETKIENTQSKGSVSNAQQNKTTPVASSATKPVETKTAPKTVVTPTATKVAPVANLNKKETAPAAPKTVVTPTAPAKATVAPKPMPAKAPVAPKAAPAVKTTTATPKASVAPKVETKAKAPAKTTAPKEMAAATAKSFAKPNETPKPVQPKD